MLGWQYLALTVDSGAAETVIPHMLVQDHAIQETDGSRNGLNYAPATGDSIPNLVEQKPPLLTQEGSLRTMTFQAAPVDLALGSVKRMCSSGHMVVFDDDDDGSYVLNKVTGEVNWMREESGDYIMDLWVMPNKSQGFFEVALAIKNDERVRPTGKSNGVVGEGDGAIMNVGSGQDEEGSSSEEESDEEMAAQKRRTC